MHSEVKLLMLSRTLREENAVGKSGFWCLSWPVEISVVTMQINLTICQMISISPLILCNRPQHQPTAVQSLGNGRTRWPLVRPDSEHVFRQTTNSHLSTAIGNLWDLLTCTDFGLTAWKLATAHTQAGAIIFDQVMPKMSHSEQ
jgi:hypothetical protein